MAIKSIWFTIFVCLLVSSPALSQTLNRCVPFFSSQRVAFDLTSLDSALNGGNYTIKYASLLNPKTGAFALDGRIEFRVCAIANVPAGCPEVPGGAFAYYFADGKCQPMVLLTSPQEKDVITVDGKVNGITIGYNNNNLDQDKQKALGPNLRMRITCNKDITNAAKWSVSTDKDYYVISTEHKAGCKNDLDDLLELVKLYKWIFAIVFIIIGGIFTFFGRHAYKWTLLLTGFIMGFLLVAVICYSFGLFHSSTENTRYVILAVSFLMGIIAGFILFKLEAVTVLIVCGVLSSLIFMAIMSTFFANLELNKYLFMAIIIAVGVIGGALGACYKE